mgnify:CR=1 FL=1
MNNIIPFEYKSNDIRVVTDDTGDPWWVAKDICGVGLGNTSQALSYLDDDEQTVITDDSLTSSRNPNVSIINESGLYSLILRSRKPEAKQFKRWITHDVLPSVRTTGLYAVGSASELDLIIQSAQAMKKIETLQIEHDQRLQILEAKTHQNSGETGYWTISAWCRLNNLTLSLEEAKRKGRQASRLSKNWNVSVSHVPDERFGTVNSYREDVLEEVFDPIEEPA